MAFHPIHDGCVLIWGLRGWSFVHAVAIVVENPFPILITQVDTSQCKGQARPSMAIPYRHGGVMMYRVLAYMRDFGSSSELAFSSAAAFFLWDRLILFSRRLSVFVFSSGLFL